MVIAGRLTAQALILALGVAAGGALWLAWVSAFGPIISEPTLQKPSSGVSLSIEEVGAPRLSAVITARPLFSSERKQVVNPSHSPRAMEVAATEPVEALVFAPSYVVSGVIVSTSLKKVLLRNNTGEKGLWVNEGEETAEGWRVLTISPDKITILKHSKHFSLNVRRHRRALASE